MEILKILSPVSKLNEVEKIVKEGADEVYCGVLTAEWQKKYNIVSINRRADLHANFWTYKELKKCVEIAHSYNTTVYLTLNQQYYTQKQHSLVLNCIEEAVNTGVDAFIVGSMDLLLTLIEINVDVDIVISTTGTVFNSEAAKFYQNMGAKRIILPRQLTLKEIEGIVKNTKNIEFEVFILNSKCPNVEGYCTFLHGMTTPRNELMYKSACQLPYRIIPANSKSNLKSAIEKQGIWQKIHMDSVPCGICALYEFREMGITGVKIVGRDNPTWKKITDVIFLRKLVDYLEKQNPTREMFRTMVRALYANYKMLLAQSGQVTPEMAQTLEDIGENETLCRISTCYFPSVMGE